MTFETRKPQNPQQVRINGAFYLFVAVILIFTARLIQLTLFRGEDLYQKSTENFLCRWRLPATRGIIYDRHGSPLAENITRYDLFFSPHRLKQKTVSSTLRSVSDLLDLDVDRLEEKVKSLKWKGDTVTVARNLDLVAITPLMEQQHRFPGIEIHHSLKRRYPLGEKAAHIAGYLGAITPEQLDAFLAKGYTRSDHIGITGVEYIHEQNLRGTDGYELVVRNARGSIIDRAIEKPAVPGKHLVLSIDAALQEFCWEQMQGIHGVIIVENPRNGEILAMVSAPSFDPHIPASSTQGEEISLLNRAIQGIYYPGSTIKPIFALAVLESGVSPDKKIFCSGRFYLPRWRQPFLCNQGNGHGYVDVEEALKLSCNTYFYHYGQELGGAVLLRYAQRFCFGSPTGIDLPFEKESPLVAVQPKDLTRGRLVMFSIGQGDLLVTPIQMVCAYAAIANKGWVATPHLFKEAVDERNKTIYSPLKSGTQISIDEAARERIIEGMRRVINESGGTAYRAGFEPEWNAAGKTGSAQNARGGTDAWFICFAPHHAPHVLVLVLIEDGGSGGRVAAPIARDILEFYFNNYSDAR